MNLSLYFFILFFIAHVVHSNECSNKSQLKVGLIENEYIDYKYYLYYTLGEYSLKNSIEFSLNTLKDNADEFDIIFGEYDELKKLSLISTSYPIEVSNFYNENSIEISKNILPLDLDTFILLSNYNEKSINLESLIKKYSPFKYTIGMSFISPRRINNLMKYILYKNETSFSDINFELKLNLFSNIYRNLNKNILLANNLDLYSSYVNDENIYTLFSDGILLNKDIGYNSYQLFPLSKYKWNAKEGFFNNNDNSYPYSFFGFSAYINDPKQFGFLCYLVNKKVRTDAFQKFNIELSPLSLHEVSHINNIDDSYKSILKNKNKYIIHYNNSVNDQDYKLMENIIINKNSYDLFLNQKNNYLN